MQDTLDLFSVTRTDNNSTISPQQPLREYVKQAMQNYFAQLGDTMPSNLYELVLAEVEVPLLEEVMRKTNYNQTKTAVVLGLSRGTLRKKLKQYNLD